MFHQAVDFVQNLQWPNELQHCRFLTVLSKVIGIALEQYTYSIETMINEDIFPRTSRDQESLTPSAMFFGKAQQLIGGKPVKDLDAPLDFTKEVSFIQILFSKSEKSIDQLIFFFLKNSFV